MKKQILLLLTCLIGALILFSSCQKDGNLPVIKTKTELLSQSAWKFSTATVSGTNASDYLQACQKDNVYSFIATGTGSINEGSSKCDPNDPQSNPFTWSFTNSEAMLNISTILFTGGSNDFTLVSLNESQLVVSQNYPPYGTIVVTFIH
ncbi:MAG: lipocalin family protein [Bacteroidia bacterium]|nr:lipocalin family protein [Bacteroidia bacterium]